MPLVYFSESANVFVLCRVVSSAPSLVCTPDSIVKDIEMGRESREREQVAVLALLYFVCPGGVGRSVGRCVPFPACQGRNYLVCVWVCVSFQLASPTARLPVFLFFCFLRRYQPRKDVYLAHPQEPAPATAAAVL